jgi:TPP-dependent 2-oxoacid decarboxylase
MGYEIPAAMGVRWANPNADNRVMSFIGDGTFVMAPTELVTACQENLPLTVRRRGKPRIPGDPSPADVALGFALW